MVPGHVCTSDTPGYALARVKKCLGIGKYVSIPRIKIIGTPWGRAEPAQNPPLCGLEDPRPYVYPNVVRQQRATCAVGWNEWECRKKECYFDINVAMAHNARACPCCGRAKGGVAPTPALFLTWGLNLNSEHREEKQKYDASRPRVYKVPHC